MRGTTGLALMACIAQSLTAQAGRQALPAAARVSVLIRGTQSDLRIVGTDQLEVRLTGGRGTLHGSPQSIIVEGSGTSPLQLALPRDARVMVRVTGGSVEVSNVIGTLNLDTQSGTIEVSGAPRSIIATSSSGSITVRGGGIDGTRVETGSGRVMAEIERGALELSLLHGEVSVSGRLATAKVFNVSGSVVIDATVAPDGTLEIESALASISLCLPATMAAQYHLQSTRNTIRNAFGPPAPVRNAPDEPLRHAFRIGDRGATVRATSIGGPVALLARSAGACRAPEVQTGE